jgi:hypothetical protein
MSRSHSRGLTRRSFLGLAVASTASACASIPTNSQPVAVRTVESSDVGAPPGPDVQIVPQGPQPGASARDIVNGFLTASSEGTDARHQVARQFLTSEQQPKWDDHAKTVVGRVQYVNPVPDDANSVSVDFQQAAVIDADGAYTPTSGSLSFTLKLAKDKDGELRITNPPPGLLVSSYDFAQHFHAVDIYFLTPDREMLVPDQRYFETATTSLANRAMQALLAGPSKWLAPAVQSAVPKGATLYRNVVQDYPTITVDLDNLGTLSQSDLRNMSAQIVWTLTDIGNPAPDSVSILTDGQPLSIPKVTSPQQRKTWSDLDPAVMPENATFYVVDGGKVWEGTGSPAPGPAGSSTAYELDSVAVSLDRDGMAGVSKSKNQARLWMGAFGGKLDEVLKAGSLTAPTWGRSATGKSTSSVWVVRDGEDVLEVSYTGDPKQIDLAKDDKLRPVKVFRLARDGTRVALIGADGVLRIARVSVGSAGLSVDGFRPFPQLDDVTDVAWASPDSVVAVGSDASGSPTVWTASVDGSEVSARRIDGLPDEPTGIAAAPGMNVILSAGSANQVGYLSESGQTWTRQITDGVPLYGAAPAYPD